MMAKMAPDGSAAIALHRWAETVQFEVKPGRTLMASSVEEAVEHLLTWRGLNTFKVRSAVSCCINAMAGECSSEEARTAFLAATRELIEATAKNDEGEEQASSRMRVSRPRAFRRPLPWYSGNT